MLPSFLSTRLRGRQRCVVCIKFIQEPAIRPHSHSNCRFPCWGEVQACERSIVFDTEGGDVDAGCFGCKGEAIIVTDPLPAGGSSKRGNGPADHLQFAILLYMEGGSCA